ncbi:MAG: S1/P1 nuclease [Bacteriovoracaceae bacterium]
MKMLLLMSLILPFSAQAWGPTGHRVTGEIAQKYLTPKALLKVNEILKNDSLAKVANWPDEIRSEPQTYSNTYVWHYTEWKDNTDDHAETQLTGLLLTYIKFHLDVLKNEAAKPEDKVFSLKFITHLVGDLHQPYHVGNGTDQGGNKCKIVYFDQPTNLHKVWDEDMINSTKLSFSEIVDFATQALSLEKIKTVQSGDLNDWAKESKEIRSLAYPNEVTPPANVPMPLLGGGDAKAYCQSGVTPDIMPKLSYEYNYRFMSTLNRRLMEGGVRLAMVLNQVFDDGQTDIVPTASRKKK